MLSLPWAALRPRPSTAHVDGQRSSVNYFLAGVVTDLKGAADLIVLRSLA